MRALLAAVDLGRPWLAPYRACLVGLRAAADSASVAGALDAAATAQGGIAHTPGALRFVAPDAAPAGEPYEAFIARTARVPTRDNLHDLFNGLSWLTFPAIKRRLNELQAGEIAAHGVGDRRGPVRDALTLFDENGAWLQAPPALADALRARDWRALFVTHRAAWQQARLLLFGHALLEKLCAPRPAITAHVWLLPPADDPLAALRDELTPERLAARAHHPLPVLGVPGWWPANESPSFYDDVAAFRPAAPRRGEIRN